MPSEKVAEPAARPASPEEEDLEAAEEPEEEEDGDEKEVGFVPKCKKPSAASLDTARYKTWLEADRAGRDKISAVVTDPVTRENLAEKKQDTLVDLYQALRVSTAMVSDRNVMFRLRKKHPGTLMRGIHALSGAITAIEGKPNVAIQVNTVTNYNSVRQEEEAILARLRKKFGAKMVAAMRMRLENPNPKVGDEEEEKDDAGWGEVDGKPGGIT